MKPTVQTPKILIVDDGELDTLILKRQLSRIVKDYEIEADVNGSEAIDRLLKDKFTNNNYLPDYIFLDINMPVMNGWEFLEEFDRLNIDPHKKVHIYILSSSLSHSDIVKSNSNPLVSAYLYKPIDTRKLKEILYAA